MASATFSQSLPIRQRPPSKSTRRNLPRTKRANKQKNCPLLCLPPELRNLIYTYAFSSEVPKNVFRSRLPVESPLDIIDLENAITLAPSNDLLATCWRIHNEAHGIFIASRRAFWKSNTILVDLRDDWKGAADNEVKAAADITLLRHDLLCLVPRLVVSVRVGSHSDEYHLIKHYRRHVHSLTFGVTGRDPLLNNPAKVFRAQLERMSIGRLMVDMYRTRLSLAHWKTGRPIANYRSLAKNYIRISSASSGSMSKMEEHMMRGLSDAVRRFVEERERRMEALHHDVLSAVVEHLCERHNVRQKPRLSDERSPSLRAHLDIIMPASCPRSMFRWC